MSKNKPPVRTRALEGYKYLFTSADRSLAIRYVLIIATLFFLSSYNYDIVLQNTDSNLTKIIVLATMIIGYLSLLFVLGLSLHEDKTHKEYMKELEVQYQKIIDSIKEAPLPTVFPDIFKIVNNTDNLYDPLEIYDYYPDPSEEDIADF
jgi:hypothetical protein